MLSADNHSHIRLKRLAPKPNRTLGHSDDTPTYHMLHLWGWHWCCDTERLFCGASWAADYTLMAVHQCERVEGPGNDPGNKKIGPSIPEDILL